MGNPGRTYARTRHNVGFMVVDALARRWGFGAGRKAFCSLVFDGRVSPGDDPGREQRVILAQPQTYMNCSGQAVKGIAAFYGISCEDILIVLDDLALPPGKLRIRRDGSAGGHKGLANVQALLGVTEIPRLRIGIGEAPEYMDAVDFVLKPMGEDELVRMKQAIDVAIRAVEDWLALPLDDVMGTYNGMAF